MSDTSLVQEIRFAINEATEGFVSDEKINDLAMIRAREETTYNFPWRTTHRWGIRRENFVLLNARLVERTTGLGYSLKARGSIHQDSLTEFAIVTVATPTIAVEGDLTAADGFQDGDTVQIQGSANNDGLWVVINAAYSIGDDETTFNLSPGDGQTHEIIDGVTDGNFNRTDSRDNTGQLIEVKGAALPFKVLVVDVIQFLLVRLAKEVGSFQGRAFHFVIEDLHKQISRYQGPQSFG